MKYSVYKADITPRMPVYMDGYGKRNGRSKGVRDNLYVKSVFLKDDNCSFLVISADICCIKREDADGLKIKITEKYGLPEQNIVIHAVHPHSGPALIAWLMHDYDGEYVEFFKGQVLKCVDACLENVKTGTMYYGDGETYIGMSRRKKTGKEVRLAPASDTPVDRKLNVIMIKGENEKIELVIYNCACHPTVMNETNYMISADFPGAACETIEKNYPGAVAVFIQGACGDINPAIISNGPEYRESYFSDVEFTGRILANDVNHIIRYGLKKIEPSFKCSIRRLVLPIGEYEVDFFKEMSESDNEYWRKYGNTMLEDIKKGEEVKETEFILGVIRLAPNLKIVALEGEICNEYGVWIRESDPSAEVLVAAYSNGYKSYLPTKRILKEGGYEATATYCWSSYPGPYSEKVQDIVLGAVKEELTNI